MKLKKVYTIIVIAIICIITVFISRMVLNFIFRNEITYHNSVNYIKTSHNDRFKVSTKMKRVVGFGGAEDYYRCTLYYINGSSQKKLIFSNRNFNINRYNLDYYQDKKVKGYIIGGNNEKVCGIIYTRLLGNSKVNYKFIAIADFNEISSKKYSEIVPFARKILGNLYLEDAISVSKFLIEFNDKEGIDIIKKYANGFFSKQQVLVNSPVDDYSKKFANLLHKSGIQN